MKHRFRICYFCGGDSLHDIRFLHKLVERGYDTYAVYLHTPTSFSIPGTHSLSLNVGKFFLRQHLPFLPIVRGIEYMSRWIIGSWIASKKLKKILKEIKPDILHGSWIQTCGFISAISNFHPFLLMPFGSDVLLVPFENPVFKQITKYSIKKADMITCDAEIIKKHIIHIAHYPAERIVVFPRGVDLSLFHPNQRIREEMRRKLGCEDKKVIVMNRNFKPVYGIEYFLRSLPLILSKEQNIYVLLIGDGPLKPSFEKMVEEHGLERVVKFIGRVDNRDMPAYLNASDLYVSSSLSDGTPVSLLEAMACALPVVVTDVPAVLEWVKDGYNGLVVPRRSVSELAEAIIEILKEEELAREMGRRNYEIARERADWEKNFGKLEGMYSRLYAEYHS